MKIQRCPERRQGHAEVSARAPHILHWVRYRRHAGTHPGPDRVVAGSDAGPPSPSGSRDPAGRGVAGGRILRTTHPDLGTGLAMGSEQACPGERSRSPSAGLQVKLPSRSKPVVERRPALLFSLMYSGYSMHAIFKAYMLWITKEQKKQLAAVWEWLSGIVHDSELILLETGKAKKFFTFRFPARRGGSPKRVLSSKGNRAEPSFVIRVSTNNSGPLGDNWVSILHTPEFRVYESKQRKLDTSPLRWGLNDMEIRLCVQIAREAVERTISAGQISNAELFKYCRYPFTRFSLCSGVGVNLWIRGELRGSAFLSERRLAFGIAEAAARAARDFNFKPLMNTDLDRLRIEITITSDLMIPFHATSLTQASIFSSKGYRIESGSGVASVLLPSRFNIHGINRPHEFLAALPQRNAEFNADSVSNQRVCLFETNSFISTAASAPLRLDGPVTTEISGRSILGAAAEAANWLVLIQETDGNIPPIIDPLMGRKTQIDWPRLALTGWALAEYGKVIGNQKYVAAARAAHNFLGPHLLGGNSVIAGDRLLTTAYFGQLSLALGNVSDASEASTIALRGIQNVTFEPVLFSHSVSLAIAISGLDDITPNLLEGVISMLREKFNENLNQGKYMYLAHWAELVNAFVSIDSKFSGNVAVWLKEQQLLSAERFSSTTSNSTNTPVIAKIFEVLALDPEGNHNALEKNASWLMCFQYTADSAFFVRDDVLPFVLGGFRCNYFNPDARIDAAAHFLLGVARLRSRNAYPLLAQGHGI